jgi:hypothetical protein
LFVLRRINQVCSEATMVQSASAARCAIARALVPFHVDVTWNDTNGEKGGDKPRRYLFETNEDPGGVWDVEVEDDASSLVARVSFPSTDACTEVALIGQSTEGGWDTDVIACEVLVAIKHALAAVGSTTGGDQIRVSDFRSWVYRGPRKDSSVFDCISDSDEFALHGENPLMLVLRRPILEMMTGLERAQYGDVLQVQLSLPKAAVALDRPFKPSVMTVATVLDLMHGVRYSGAATAAAKKNICSGNALTLGALLGVDDDNDAGKVSSTVYKDEWARDVCTSLLVQYYASLSAAGGVAGPSTPIRVCDKTANAKVYRQNVVGVEFPRLRRALRWYVGVASDISEEVSQIVRLVINPPPVDGSINLDNIAFSTTRLDLMGNIYDLSMPIGDFLREVYLRAVGAFESGKNATPAGYANAKAAQALVQECVDAFAADLSLQTCGVVFVASVSAM